MDDLRDLDDDDDDLEVDRLDALLADADWLADDPEDRLEDRIDRRDQHAPASPTCHVDVRS
eukprot:567826-Prorocentrum_minimum.AAC.2